MSPRHFAKHQNDNFRKEHDNGLHNAFTAFTKVIGLGKFFSFIPGGFHYNPRFFGGSAAGDKKDYDPTTNPPISQ